MNQINLTPILNAMILVLSAVITTFLIPWIKRKISAEDLKTLEKWVEIAVAAAEQLYGAEQRAEKKKWVLEYLESHGYTVDPSIDSMVEAQVLALHRELYGEWSNDGT